MEVNGYYTGRGVNLVHANLTGANLEGAFWDEFTEWPEGFTPPKR